MSKIMKKHDFLDFSDFRGAFTAPTGGTEGVARCYLEGLGMRHEKIKTNEKNR